MTHAQTTFDFLVPYRKPLLRPEEAARCLGRGIHHVYDLIDEGKLEAHGVADREKSRKVVTRRSVVAVLAETATYKCEDFTTRVESLVEELDLAQLDRLIRAATQRRHQLQQQAA